MVRVSILRMTLFIAAVLSIVSFPTCEAGKHSPLQKPDEDNLIDLLDVPMDEKSLIRDLQETSMAPTPAAGDASTSSLSFAPTLSPVYDVRGLETMAPTSVFTAAPTETSDAMGMVPASSAVAIAVILAVTVVMA